MLFSNQREFHVPREFKQLLRVWQTILTSSYLCIFLFQAGHICGDNIDVINNKPTGSIRISFGHYSTEKDADLVIRIIKDHFISNFDALNNSVRVPSKKKVISALYLYPVKSCAALKITKVT